MNLSPFPASIKFLNGITYNPILLDDELVIKLNDLLFYNIHTNVNQLKSTRNECI